MSIPFPTNTTCDIYRAGRQPPQTPDVAGVNCFLQADWSGGQEHGEGRSATENYTHILYVDVAVDIRDAWGPVSTTQQDTVYIPDKNGTPFYVIFVERVFRGTANDSKRAYLQRYPGTVGIWPTENL
jgi:hypothetical protein